MTALPWFFLLMRRGLCLCVVELVAYSACAGAQSSEQRSSRLVWAMAGELRERAHLPGLSVAVARQSRIVAARGFGYADLARAKLVTTSTQFRTASVGKVITATALATLVQRGKLNLDEPVQTYVPDFPRKAWPVTARQLAGHLSGIPHYNSADKLESRFYPSVRDALSVFAAESLLFEPGTRYTYSTHGITLLSAVIEGAAGKPFLDYLTEAVLRPLSMRSTGPHRVAAPSPAMTVLYAVKNGVPSRVEHPEDPSYKWAAGGLISTPSDLVRLTAGYFNGFLDTSTVSMMFESQRLVSGRETGVGIGWRKSFDMDGRAVVEHAGSMEGTRTVVSMFPASRVAVAIMANTEWSSMIEETAHMLALPFLTERSPLPQPEGSASVVITMLKGNGASESQTGTLRLHGGTGALTVDAGQSTAQSYALIYLERGDVYALVRPDGIVHLTLSTVGDSISGKAIAYGSPRTSPPSGNVPFLTFGGVLSRK